MKRYLLSLVILFAGLGWLAVGAPVWGGQSLLRPAEDIASKLAGSAKMMSPEQESEAKDILFRDETIKAITEGRQLGRDYWLFFQQVLGEDQSTARRGPVIAIAMMYFDPSISYQGKAPVKSNPCESRAAEVDELPFDDPCYRQPVVYETKDVTWPSVNEVRVSVDLSDGRVVDLLDAWLPPDELQYEIELRLPDGTSQAAPGEEIER